MGANVYRKDVESNKSTVWISTNKILPRGLIGHESDTNKIKVGDGTSRWNDLPYISGSGPGSGLEIDEDGYLTLAEGVTEIVPREDQGGGLGVNIKRWLEGWFVNLFCTKLTTSNVETPKWVVSEDGDDIVVSYKGGGV
jgi:hypothetical protein